MLWYKGWLETRLRLLFVLGFVVVFLYMPHMHPRGTTRMAVLGFQSAVPTLALMFCALLAGAGIATQAPFQATKGMHGSMLFTLSLPVSRLRLLAVRATVGWLELTGVLSLICSGLWIASPLLKTMVVPREMFEYAATLIVCSTAVYCLSVLLATFLEDQWRIWGTMIASAGVWWLSREVRLPASTDIFQAMSMGSPLMTHTMPWAAMAFAFCLATGFFLAALKIAQSREY